MSPVALRIKDKNVNSTRGALHYLGPDQLLQTRPAPALLCPLSPRELAAFQFSSYATCPPIAGSLHTVPFA